MKYLYHHIVWNFSDISINISITSNRIWRQVKYFMVIQFWYNIIWTKKMKLNFILKFMINHSILLLSMELNCVCVCVWEWWVCNILHFMNYKYSQCVNMDKTFDVSTVALSAKYKVHIRTDVIATWLARHSSELIVMNDDI